MRISTLLTVVSLFLVGSYSLPQPEDLEASRTIEGREAKVPTGASHGGGPEGWGHHKSDGDGSGSSSPSTNGTKIKERQGPPGGDFKPPNGMTWKDFMKHKMHKGGSASQSASVPLSTDTSSSADHSSSSSSTGTNSTEVKMMKFRD